MDCEQISERLSECAKSHSHPDQNLRTHMRSCAPCSERWEAERDLSAAFAMIRARAAGERSSAASKARLMREFDARNVRRMTPRWYWGLAAAATLLLGVLLGPEVGRQLHPTVPSSMIAADYAAREPEVDPEGFIAVPYARPLADGEMMRIVHTELNPAALASLGVSVDPTWTTQLPADLLLGEDGMPRAVRVSEADSEEGGF